MDNPEFHRLGSEKLVVTKDGQKVGTPHNTLEEANAAAKTRRALEETSGQAQPQIKVVQQLNG
jgi:hypothetical protein